MAALQGLVAQGEAFVPYALCMALGVTPPGRGGPSQRYWYSIRV